MQVFERFERIGRAVDQRWRERNYDEEALPELASAVLAEELPRGSVSARDVLRWVLSTHSLPQQFDPESKFGQPPVTMYRGPRFFVDALFWLESTTDIHQHAFEGAFHVLEGSSVHTRYGFELEERVSSALLLGQVRFRDFELLGPGDTRPIHAGDRLIHALFHLESPSVSVVVRTYRQLVGGPQYLYHPPFLAEDPFFEDPVQRRRLEALAVMREMDEAAYEDALGDLVAEADLHTIFKVATQFVVKRQDFDRLRALLERARPRQGDRIDRLAPVLEEMTRIKTVTTKRSLLTGADQRFFLGMILNLPTRRAILDAVERRYPGRDAIGLIADWTGELADAIRAAKDDGEDHTLAVFAEMLRGHEGDELIARLKEEYDAGDVEAMRDQIGEIERSLRAATILRPLFRGD
jgi:hypothetical protein